MRVHELAKKIGKTSKEILPQIRELGGEVKNHMSVVDEAIAAKLLPSGASSAPAAPAKKSKKKEKAPAKKKAASKTSKPAVAQSSKPEPKAEPQKETAPPAPKPAPEPKKSEPAATASSKTVQIRLPITVGNLAEAVNIKIPELIKVLMGMGIFANVNQLLSEEVVAGLSEKIEVEIEKIEDETEQLIHEEEDLKSLKFRPPVVTMMGHVDHGKTSLLDAIRKTNVAAREKGAITQHIGAYGVDVLGKGHVTFLDTPGHEAFTAMRARGANVTDVVVLVVAADDGVMPQTVEAAAHAREAGCPIIVAINKADLPSANLDKVKGGLQKLDLMPEEWGGKTICCKVSAKTGAGIDHLLEMLLLEAEVLELKANPERKAIGTVIEGHLSRGSGPVATVIVQKGTLRIGDVMVCGQFNGKVRALRNDLGKHVKDAGPSYAVEVAGLNGVPEAGESFYVVADEPQARKLTEKKILEMREKQQSGASKHLALEDLYNKISEGNFKELKIILKADVQGSMEALSQSLEKLSNEQCRVRVIHAGIGGVNESDVVLAAASDAIVLGFHVKADQKAENLAEREGVDIRFYHIIYEAVEEVRNALEGLLEPTYEEVEEGRIEIRKVFKSSKVGNIGGGMVIKGKVVRNNPVRLVRDNVVVFSGKISSLKRFKDDVREVLQGYECGVALEKYDDLKEGDVVESYRVEKIATKLV